MFLIGLQTQCKDGTSLPHFKYRILVFYFDRGAWVLGRECVSLTLISIISWITWQCFYFVRACLSFISFRYYVWSVRMLPVNDANSGARIFFL